jgi:hypothetical protein
LPHSSGIVVLLEIAVESEDSMVVSDVLDVVTVEVLVESVVGAVVDGSVLVGVSTVEDPEDWVESLVVATMEGYSSSSSRGLQSSPMRLQRYLQPRLALNVNPVSKAVGRLSRIHGLYKSSNFLARCVYTIRNRVHSDPNVPHSAANSHVLWTLPGRDADGDGGG